MVPIGRCMCKAGHEAVENGTVCREQLGVQPECRTQLSSASLCFENISAPILQEQLPAALSSFIKLWTAGENAPFLVIHQLQHLPLCGRDLAWPPSLRRPKTCFVISFPDDSVFIDHALALSGPPSV
ncbi:hypothetical protein MHYP_G00273710 [Metynnis hypsauchen]